MKTIRQKALAAPEVVKALPPSKAAPGRAEIALAAYFIWEGRGRPEGKDLDHWLDAEEELAAAENLIPFEL